MFDRPDNEAWFAAGIAVGSVLATAMIAIAAAIEIICRA